MGNDIRSKMMTAWEGSPPTVKFISQPMPGTPYLELSGQGFAISTPLKQVIKELENDLRCQRGRYYAYVMGGCRDEADTYLLDGWEVVWGEDTVYEGIVILYYSALNPYLTIKKHFGEAEAEEYLARNAAMSVIADAFAEV